MNDNVKRRSPFIIHHSSFITPWRVTAVLLLVLLFLLVVGKWRGTATGSQVQVPMFYDAHYLFPRPWTQAQEAPGVPDPFPVAFYGPNTITQSFISGADNLAMIALWLQGSPYGWVDVTLADETGPLYTAQIDFPENPQGRTVHFSFPTIAEAEGRRFWLTLAAPASVDAEPAITHVVGGDRLGGAIGISEYQRPGNLALQTYVGGTAVVAALTEQLLPDLFRLRLRQLKPAPFKGELFATLLMSVLLLSGLFLVLARPSTINLKTAVGWGSVGLLAFFLMWQIGRGRVRLPLLQPARAMVEANTSQPSFAANEWRTVNDLVLLLWTAERKPEERFVATAIYEGHPAIIVPAESALRYALDVPPNGRLRVGVLVKEAGQLRYTILFNDVVLTADLVDEEPVWLDVDLRPFAGQGGFLRLVTEPVDSQPEGYWVQPQILAQRDWLLSDLPATAVATAYRFTDGVELVGYEVTEAGVTLYWRTERPLLSNATVFVHGRNAAGELIAQHDGQPVGNSYPLTIWPSGVIIADTHPLILPDGADPMTTLAIGLYDPATSERWSVTNPDGTTNSQKQAILPVETAP